MRFTVQAPDGERDVEPELGYALLAGYTGRDQDAVRVHIEELAAHGVAAPKSVPAAYPVPATRVVAADRIAVHGSRTAGEAEFFLVDAGGTMLVGVGSDHTDRELEEHSVVKSKQTCDKPVAPTVWRLDDVADHWDELQLRAEVHGADGWTLYQDGTVGSMLTPRQILDFAAETVGSLDGVAVFSGTLPLIGGEFRYGDGFRATLHDPVLGRTLVCEYAVEELPDIPS